MPCCLAIEYAVQGSCDGGADVSCYSNTEDAIAAILDLAWGDDVVPVGADPDATEEQCRQWDDDFSRLVHSVVWDAWHDPAYDGGIYLPWRPGFLIRVWHVSPEEARCWDE